MPGKKYHHENIEFLQGNAAKSHRDNSVDVVISFETIEHLDEKTQEFF